mgnify:FL=1
MKRKTFSKEVKQAVAHELATGTPVAQVCREHEITPNMAYRWQREYERDPANAFAGKGHAVKLEARVAQLERTVGKLYLENEFLKKVHQALQQQLAEAKNER